MKVRIINKHSNFVTQIGEVEQDDREVDGSILVALPGDTTWFWAGEYEIVESEDPKPDLVDIIKEIESHHFRTNSDTGANANALFIWNILREHAGLPRLTRDDLRQRQVDTSSEPDLTVDKLKKFEDWRKDYSLWNNHTMNQRKYDEIAAMGGYQYLLKRLDQIRG